MTSKEKDAPSQQEIEAKNLEQFNLNQEKAESFRKSNDYVEFVKATLEKPPYDSEDESIKQQFVNLVNQALSNFTPEEMKEKLFSKLSDDELMILFDYVNKSFELIHEGKFKSPVPTRVNANFFLKMFAKFTDYKGKNMIIRGISRKRSLVKRQQWEF